MSGDGLSLAGLADHEQLGKNGNALQVDAEGPQDLKRGELVVDKEGKTTNRHDKKLSAEGVVIAVIGGLELHVDEIDGEVGAAYVDALHHTVVERDEIGEEVQVASGEDKRKENLRLSGDTRA